MLNRKSFAFCSILVDWFYRSLIRIHIHHHSFITKSTLTIPIFPKNVENLIFSLEPNFGRLVFNFSFWIGIVCFFLQLDWTNQWTNHLLLSTFRMKHEFRTHNRPKLLSFNEFVVDFTYIFFCAVVWFYIESELFTFGIFSFFFLFIFSINYSRLNYGYVWLLLLFV